MQDMLRNGVLSAAHILILLSLSAGPAMAAEPETDRPGMDYRNLDLATPDPGLCESACRDDPGKCRAWTYVKPGLQGEKARCWLKTGIPPAVKNADCVSGTVQQAVKTTRPKPLSQQPPPVPAPRDAEASSGSGISGTAPQAVKTNVIAGGKTASNFRG